MEIVNYFENSIWAKKLVILLTLTSLVAACGERGGSGAIIYPTVVAAMTETPDLGELMPPLGEIPIEGNPEVLAIQKSCREFMQEPNADLCLGVTRVEGKEIWSGVIGPDYAAGTIVTLWGYLADGSSVEIFAGATVAQDGSLVTPSIVELEYDMALMAEIGGLGDLAPATNIVPAETSGGSGLFLFTVPPGQKHETPGSHGDPNT